MEDKEQRTEEATPFRQENLRKEGKVAKSTDIHTAAIMAAFLAVFFVIGPGFVHRFQMISRISFRVDANRDLRLGASLVQEIFFYYLIPVFVVLGAAAFISGLVQTKGLFTMGALKFNFDTLNPIPNMKKVLPSSESMQELLKSVLKLALVGFIVGNAVINEWSTFSLLSVSPLQTGLSKMTSVIGRLVLNASIIFIVIAALDLLWSKRQFAKQNMMSRQEVRDEHKQQEGDPMIKSRVRARMRSALARRKETDLSNATVVVTNPTHISVALRYRPNQDMAPVLLAKGQDSDALDIRAKARRHGVPIIENKALAREIYKTTKVLEPIPASLYKVAAEVISHVLRLRGEAQI